MYHEDEMWECDRCGGDVCDNHITTGVQGGALCEDCIEETAFADGFEEEYQRECQERNIAGCSNREYGEPPCGDCPGCEQFDSS